MWMWGVDRDWSGEGLDNYAYRYYFSEFLFNWKGSYVLRKLKIENWKLRIRSWRCVGSRCGEIAFWKKTSFSKDLDRWEFALLYYFSDIEKIFYRPRIRLRNIYGTRWGWSKNQKRCQKKIIFTMATQFFLWSEISQMSSCEVLQTRSKSQKLPYWIEN